LKRGKSCLADYSHTLSKEVLEIDGSGDKKVQAYASYVSFTDIQRIRFPFKKPAGYEEINYELLLGIMKQEKPDPWIQFLHAKIARRLQITVWVFSTDL